MNHIHTPKDCKNCWINPAKSGLCYKCRVNPNRRKESGLASQASPKGDTDSSVGEDSCPGCGKERTWSIENWLCSCNSLTAPLEDIPSEDWISDLQNEVRNALNVSLHIGMGLHILPHKQQNSNLGIREGDKHKLLCDLRICIEKNIPKSDCKSVDASVVDKYNDILTLHAVLLNDYYESCTAWSTMSKSERRKLSDTYLEHNKQFNKLIMDSLTSSIDRDSVRNSVIDWCIAKLHDSNRLSNPRYIKWTIRSIKVLEQLKTLPSNPKE